MVRILLFSLFIALFSIHSGRAYAQDDFRKLDELCREGRAEAYPWISPDGLRLYYIAEDDNNPEEYGLDVVFMSERKSQGGRFSKPQPVPMNFKGGVTSAWLTQDELTIYLVVESWDSDFGEDQYPMVVGTRESMNSPFTDFRPIELMGVDGFVSGPSLTPNLTEMYLYYSTNTDMIIRLTGIDAYTFRVTDTLPFPEGHMPRPGQLSKDGLRFYLGIELEDGSSSIQYIERESPQQAFNSMYPHGISNRLIRQELNTKGGNHPSVTGDESIIVIAEAKEDSWAENDLYIGTTGVGHGAQGARQD